MLAHPDPQQKTQTNTTFTVGLGEGGGSGTLKAYRHTLWFHCQSLGKKEQRSRKALVKVKGFWKTSQCPKLNKNVWSWGSYTKLNQAFSLPLYLAPLFLISECQGKSCYYIKGTGACTFLFPFFLFFLLLSSKSQPRLSVAMPTLRAPWLKGRGSIVKNLTGLTPSNRQI